ncbi:MAG TPA: class I SAM-dependent methyltransferase [Sphingomonas sp.]|jgi:hypothetical protein|nr:class I SAM-dependent methyltransferase [Sphingomonas sp.]
MSSFLIHSMSEFAETILQCMTIAKAKTIVEVGAEFGGMSQRLANHARDNGGTLTSIDPAPKPEFLDWVKGETHVRHIAKPSLEALPKLSKVDAWVIDGDHNYYTVSNELAIAHKLSGRDGKPFLAILHDVGWPCARRDQYYSPDHIPAEHLQPHSWSGGVTPGDPGMRVDRGFRGMGQFAYARQEGGPRNGVLTAVEDFLEDVRADGAELAFATIPAVFGLGIVFASDAPWSEEMAALLLPFHQNPLIARLEENRLRNFLALIDRDDVHR